MKFACKVFGHKWKVIGALKLNQKGFRAQTGCVCIRCGKLGVLARR